jgi:long-chain acyl-CoA synthetase
MTSHANTLRELLDEWEAAKIQNASAKAISQNLLKVIEAILSSEKSDAVDTNLWHQYLHVSANSDYLQALTDRDQQYRWAEAVFKIIRISNFTLKTMFDQRVSENPNRVLFQYMAGSTITQWSYEQIARHVKEIAAVLFSAVEDEPRVAIVGENCVESACCDLACLLYDILDTPLNIHFNTETLAGIFKQLKINIVVTDTESRCQQLLKLREITDVPFILFVLNPEISADNTNTIFLGEHCKRLTKDAIDNILHARPKRKLTKVATIMFTSGSTGKPKGVAFSQYHLITKRFARAAALPKVGNNEVLLCYLPLYHTFGRYLEMLGTIYWNGTYVFAENPSAETLISA